MFSKGSSIKEIEGGTLDRWKRFLQRADRPREQEDFLPAEELEPWSTGLDSTDFESVTTQEFVASKSSGIIPETRVIKETQVSVKTNTEIKSALGPGTLIEGKFTFDSPVRIDGTIKGEVHSQSLLIIGEDGVVDGLLCVGSLIVNGRAKGHIVCEEFLQIGSTGEVIAEIESAGFAIDVGGAFEGTVKRKK